MNIYKKINIIITLLVPISLSSQGLDLTILDAENRSPLVGVVLTCGSDVWLSNSEGIFFDINCSSKIQISHLAYEPLDLDRSNMTNLDTILLRPSSNILEEITVSASRNPTSISKSTASLELIHSKRLELENTPNISDLLNRINSVQIVDGQPNIRGGSGYSYGAGSRVLIMMNGMPMLQNDAAIANWQDIPTELIDRVEVLKGASSILYGSSALNGVIDIQTVPSKYKNETILSSQYQVIGKPPNDSLRWWSHSPITSTSSIVHRHIFGKTGVQIGAFYNDSQSHIQNRYNRQLRFTGGLHHDLNSNWQLGLFAMINDSEGNNPFYWKGGKNEILQTDSSSFSPVDAMRIQIDPYVKYIGDKGSVHSLKTRYYAIENNSIDSRSNQSQQYQAEYQHSYRVNTRLRITSGMAFSQTRSDSELYSNSTFNQINYGVFSQVEHSFANQLSVVAGIRYERNATQAPDSIPNFVVEESLNKYDRMVGRLGLNYVFDTGSSIRANWGQAYRYPSIAERFINTNIGIPVIPNPQLLPETGWSAELAYRQLIAFGKLKAYLDLSYFHMEYDDMMEYGIVRVEGTNLLGFQANNIGSTIIRGLDISTMGEYQISTDIKARIQLGYNYIDPKYKVFTEDLASKSTSEENVLKYRQRHQLKNHFRIEYKKLTLGLTHRFYSKTEAVDRIFYAEFFIPGVQDFDDEYNGDRHIFDMMARFDLPRRWSIQLNIKNIGNTIYSLRPAQVEEIRSFAIQITKKWQH